MKKLIVISAVVLLGLFASSAVTAKSKCPCDILSTVHWAGWNGPICLTRYYDQLEYYLKLSSDDDNESPSVFLENPYEGGNICVTASDSGFGEALYSLSDKELAACEADANQLAIMLGKTDGCVVFP